LILLLSGEGPSDIGTCDNMTGFCDCSSFVPGPMAVFVDQLVEIVLGYSCLGIGCLRFVSEHQLKEIGSGLKQKRRLTLPGKKKQRETGYFEKNARALAVTAKQLMVELNDEVVAVLFRDVDGTRSTKRGLYEAKRDSMMRGFEMEEYAKGIPMMPNPQSEAWLLCAVQESPYDNCDKLENMSGNDNSPNDLKTQLEKTIGEHVGAQELAEMALDGRIDVHRIDMPSMNWFKKRLSEALS